MRTLALRVVSCVVFLAACNGGGSKEKAAVSAAPSTHTYVPRPAPSARGGPSFLDDRPIPSARPLPVASTPPGPPKASCDMRAKRATCIDFYKPAPSDKGDCESTLAGGRYGIAPCPSDKALGYCTTFDGDRRHYYDVKAPEGFGTGVDDAKLACETKHFTAAH